MILSVQNVSIAFDGKSILQNANFHIEDNEKAAIVGINGAGKTTLLNIISGKLKADEGAAVLTKGKTFGYLEQNPILDSEHTVYEELVSVKAYLVEMEQKLRDLEESMKHCAGETLDKLMEEYAALSTRFEMENGYAYKSELTGVLKGLGFDEGDFQKAVNTLSGGQKTRVALGKMLLMGPDLILLDEPTNHLDMNAIRWLETYLQNYKGAVLIVSHDRFFLNRIAKKIVEVDRGIVRSFIGNYSDYAAKKEQLRISAMNAYMNQQRELKHQKEVIDKLKSFNREKSIKRAESREKQLAKVEVLDKPTEVNADMKLSLTPSVQSGKDVLAIEHLTKAFGEEVLFSDVSMEVKRGEHVAIIGDNGTGKTTLLKIINELETAQGGEIRLGTNVYIGYYDQEHHVLHSEKSIYDEIADTYPYLTITQIRNILAAFLFTGDDVFKLIGECSGGERGRISLAKLMLSKANFLILDEPTNHLDIASKEILEDAINRYEGTILYVSHDRYFINKTAHRILELENKSFTGYLGDYEYYLEKKYGTLNPVSEEVTVQGQNESVLQQAGAMYKKAPAREETLSEGAKDWKSQKEEAARVRKLENDLKRTEDEIASLEEEKSGLEEKMADPSIATNVAELTKLQKQLEEAEEKLATLYENWELLSEQLS